MRRMTRANFRQKWQKKGCLTETNVEYDRHSGSPILCYLTHLRCCILQNLHLWALKNKAQSICKILVLGPTIMFLYKFLNLRFWPLVALRSAHSCHTIPLPMYSQEHYTHTYMYIKLKLNSVIFGINRRVVRLLHNNNIPLPIDFKLLHQGVRFHLPKYLSW